MTGEYKLQSVIKKIQVADITIKGSQKLEEHGIVLVGDRAGVVHDTFSDEVVTVNFDTQRDFTTDLFDESNLPKIGGKIYMGDADGMLTKTESGNVFVGYYWGKLGSRIVFSLKG